MKKELNLIVDIGNSTIVFGLFDKETFLASLITRTHLHSEKERKEKFVEFISKYQDYNINQGMIFAVVPKKVKVITKLVKKVLKFNILNFDWKNYNKLKKDPQITDNIGADLVADVVGAIHEYKLPLMIVDLGTVNKLLLVNKDGVFSGASFNPGMEISLELFNNKTALLPKLGDAEKFPVRAGLSTIESMQHGIYWAAVAYINEQHKAQEKLYGEKLTLIITGGNAPLVADEVKDKIHDPQLTLKGMNILYMEEK